MKCEDENVPLGPSEGRFSFSGCHQGPKQLDNYGRRWVLIRDLEYPRQLLAYLSNYKMPSLIILRNLLFLNLFFAYSRSFHFKRNANSKHNKHSIIITTELLDLDALFTVKTLFEFLHGGPVNAMTLL